MYEKFKQLLNEHNTNAYQVSKATGVSSSTLSEWKRGKYTPKKEKLQRLADYFNVPLSYFYEDNIGEQNPELIHEVSAGKGRISDDYGCADDAVQGSDEYSKVRIIGDSMYPTLHDGDIVRVHHITENITPRMYTVVKVNGDENTVKHIEITENGIWLRAENKEVFDDTFYPVSDCLILPVTIVGVAEEIIFRKL